jgi:2-iminobutanoate/2-iminopropanoate deaminase
MKKIIHTGKAPEPIGPYSQAVIAGNMLFASGQIALVPGTGELNISDIATETHQVMKNVGALLEAAGLTYSHIVKTSIFLKDMNQFAAVNEVYGSYFTKNFPARETIQVAALPRNVNVEISVLAIVG